MIFRRPTVLYVEDEETDVFLMRRAFILEGLEKALQTVEGGVAAMEYLDGKGIFADRQAYPAASLMVLDLKLPSVSGFEVLEWVRGHKDHKDLPVIIFSSSPLPSDRERAKELGANDYWVKPLSAAGWSSVVSELKHRWMEPVAEN